jgi:hypothetical protein
MKIDPASGSAPPRGVTAQEVFDVCGTLDDGKVTAIVEAGPTYEELEEAVAWAADEGDPLRALARPLSGKAAEVYEILATELETPDERD